MESNRKEYEPCNDSSLGTRGVFLACNEEPREASGTHGIMTVAPIDM